MIGIFDSGVGGLTIVREFFKYLPKCRVIYFGDTAHLPYGTKSPNLIKKWSKEIVKFLLKKGAKVIVIACHTSSAWAADFLKKEFCDTPIFEIITPGIKKAIQLTKNKKIQFKKGKKHQFFVSDEPYNFKIISKMCLGKEINPKIINL